MREGYAHGLRYVRDTGRTDSDLGPIAALAQFNNIDYTGLQDRVHQPNLNFAPQVGLAWDPTGKGKTVFRAGIGLFYENSIWNNLLYDRPARLPAVRVTLAAFSSTLTYFLSPASVIAKNPAPGMSFRLGGIVQVGTVATTIDAGTPTTSFRVTDGQASIPVTFTGVKLPMPLGSLATLTVRVS